MVSRRDKHCLCASGAEVAEPAIVPRSSPGAEACRAIEADYLGAISPGRAAAGGGHGRLAAEGERAFQTFMSDILMQRATCTIPLPTTLSPAIPRATPRYFG